MKKNRQKTKIAELANIQGRQVFQAAYRLLGDRHLAEDVTQEVFIKLFKKPPAAFDSIKNWSAYLKSMATSAAIDQLRRHQQRSEQSIDNIDPVLHQQKKSPDAGPFRQLAIQRDLVKFRQMLTRLSEQEAQIFCLRHLDEFSYQEIAEFLQISNSLVGVTLHRAQQKLSRLLGESQFLGAEHEITC